ncbi:hypothetical protein Dda_1295 [Drechslerella dactyloides]|uniref:Palmitoyltransferase PFA4 n=1 Tax=Drechslerella dactyloides TaxID=74499 RepID=A0AAD6J1H0_DREDA|nr:hypothetical protein Dda_1295 [Drechslerella dactyloides]
MLNPKYSAAAVAATVLLITFLAYASQLFVLTLDERQFWVFNALVGCIWVNYARCIFTDAGGVPGNWQPSWQKLESFGGDSDGQEDGDDNDEDDESCCGVSSGGEVKGGGKAGARVQVGPDASGRIWGNADCRWCKRCKKWKPARAHHCKTCQKCVLLMDHHCPWTFNCVGYRTWPHFLRFLTFVIAACSYLETFLVAQCLDVYRARNMPAYLGPSLQQLMLLVFLLLFNTLTDVSIIVLWLRIAANIVEGYTTIECWEQERHAALVKRKAVRRQAFPFDVGVYENLSLFMGGGILTWLLPVLPSRSVGEGNDASGGGGLRYEINGYEKSWLAWPPPDPEKFGIHERRHVQREMQSGPWTRGEYDVNDVHAFRRRQREDMKRFQAATDDAADEYASDGENSNERKKLASEDMLDSYLDSGYGMADAYYDDRQQQQRQEQTSTNTRKRWRNEEGDTLADYGVDEDADVLGEEDSVPLAELLRRRREKQALLQGYKVTMYSASLRRKSPWSAAIAGLSTSAVLGNVKESFHLPHASLNLSGDDVCFVFLDCEDVATDELAALAIRRVKLCESLARSRGILLLRTLDDRTIFDTLQRRLQSEFGEPAARSPFLLPLSNVEDLVPVLESFVRELRAQKSVQAERNEALRRARMLRSLNLLGKAVTHTNITEHAVYGIAEAFPGMAAYSEACLDVNARRGLAALLTVDERDDIRGQRLVDSLVDFWQQNRTAD